MKNIVAIVYFCLLFLDRLSRFALFVVVMVDVDRKLFLRFRVRETVFFSARFYATLHMFSDVFFFPPTFDDQMHTQLHTQNCNNWMDITSIFNLACAQFIEQTSNMTTPQKQIRAFN